MNVLKRIAMALALPAVIVAAWWVISSSSTNIFWPPLSEIIAAFPATWFEGRMREDVVPSVIRLLVGFTIAAILGVVVGVIIGLNRTLRDYCEPVLEFVRAIPPPVLIPVIMLFAGIGNEMKIIVIVIGCVWPVLLNTVEGVRGIDDVLRDTAQSYRLTGTQRLAELVLRGASPQIMVGMRQSLSLAVILMVVSEMFAASNGLGFSIVQFQRNFDIPQMWTGIILLGVIGVILAMLFQLVERRLLRWYHASQRIGKER